ncbi:MAG TPA: PKD domain-containing protein [Armatimonadota bacterium]|nr:PKD domain-containing protein [Armatimonadota bacterium]
MGKLSLGKGLPGILALAATALVLGIAGTGASAQGLFAQAELVIYGGDASQGNLTLGNWGGGVCRESTKNTYAGSKSIEITPKGLYQGGRLDFTIPLDLATWFNSRDAYLQLVTRFREGQAPQDAWTIGLTATPTSGTGTTGKQVKRVHMMLNFDGGPATECQVDLNAFKMSEGGWMTVSFPFTALKGKLNLPAYRLRRLVITGDGAEPFYIGEIRVMRDTTPLQADAGEEKEAGRNYTIVFHASAQTGASAVKYYWDFDDQNGIQEEAIGDVVYHRYPKAGDFVVTLTVCDIFGLKTPATSTVKVRVNE